VLLKHQQRSRFITADSSPKFCQLSAFMPCEPIRKNRLMKNDQSRDAANKPVIMSYWVQSVHCLHHGLVILSFWNIEIWDKKTTAHVIRLVWLPRKWPFPQWRRCVISLFCFECVAVQWLARSRFSGKVWTMSCLCASCCSTLPRTVAQEVCCIITEEARSCVWTLWLRWSF